MTNEWDETPWSKAKFKRVNATHSVSQHEPNSNVWIMLWSDTSPFLKWWWLEFAI